jgi:hypothetical protein
MHFYHNFNCLVDIKYNMMIPYYCNNCEINVAN